MRAHLAIILALGFVTCSVTNVRAVELPKNPVAVTPGLEGAGWYLEPWGNAGTAERINARGVKVLQVIYNPGDKDKSGFKHLTNFGVDEKGRIRLHVFAPSEDPPPIGLAVCTTLAYTWHESNIVKLKQGWNVVEFTPSTKEWKTEASGWKNTVAVDSAHDIRALDLLVHNGKRGGVLYVQGLNYDLDEKGKKVAALVKDLASEEMNKIEEAEKQLLAIGKPAMAALRMLKEDERPEVVLRAAALIWKLEEIKEEAPPDPKIREALERQKEDQIFDEQRRKVEYALQRLTSEKQKLNTIIAEAQADMKSGREGLGGLKFVDEERRKAYEDKLAKLEAALKELKETPITAPPPGATAAKP